jgi:hypothetical protein
MRHALSGRSRDGAFVAVDHRFEGVEVGHAAACLDQRGPRGLVSRQ